MDAHQIKQQLNAFIINALGQSCVKCSVGSGNSLSIGLGAQATYLIKGKEKKRFEWEIGTYSPAWRILFDGSYVLGGADDSDVLLDPASGIGSLKFGSLESVYFFSNVDVRMSFSGGYTVEFLAATVVDEYLHIFAPKNLYLEFHLKYGLRQGASNLPWPQE